MNHSTPQLPLFPTEEWRDIPGYEGLYQVSDRGRVRSFRYKHEKPKGTFHIINGGRTTKGYVCVCLRGHNSRKWVKVHRLVLLVFVGSPPPNTQSSHLDGNPENNRLENLVWETVSTNNLRKNEHGTMAHTRAKLTEAQVCEIRSLWPGGGVTKREIARLYGVSRSAIQNILGGKTWKRGNGGTMT